MVKRDKRNIGKRIIVVNPKSLHYGRTGIVQGFRDDKEEGNPYVDMLIAGYHIQTISGKNLEYCQ